MADEVETEETEAEAVSRSQMWKHEDIYEWLTEEGEIDSESSGPEIIAAFAARRNAYRKTQRYIDLVESHAKEAEEAKAARAEARETAKAEREAAKAAAAEEKAKAKAEAEAAGEDDEAKTTAKKTAAKKTPAKRTAARKTTKAASTDESPFE